MARLIRDKTHLCKSEICTLLFHFFFILINLSNTRELLNLEEYGNVITISKTRALRRGRRIYAVKARGT